MKDTRYPLRFLASWLALVVMALSAGCSTLPRPAPQPESGRLLQQGSVQVDPVLRCVLVTGYVNQVEGAIELMACGPGGKVHESVLVLQVNPVDLQAALLLVGLQAGPPMPDLGRGPPQGDRVLIWVQWEQDGRPYSLPLEQLAWEWRRERPLKVPGWVFTGSVFENGKFKALAEESLIVSYWDPWAILNIDSPLGADDEALTVNRDRVPPLHTPVTLLIQKP